MVRTKSQYRSPYDQIAKLCNRRNRFHLAGRPVKRQPKSAYLRQQYRDEGLFGSAYVGGRSRRLSAYNKFVKMMMPRYKGSANPMAEIAAAWRSRRSSGRGTIGGSRASMLAKLRYAMAQRGRF